MRYVDLCELFLFENAVGLSQDLHIRPDDVITVDNRNDFANRDAPVHFLNYRRPIVQESRAATAEAAQVAAERAASNLLRYQDAGGANVNEVERVEKVHAFVESTSVRFVLSNHDLGRI